MKALFIDTETSGLDSQKNLLLEIAMVCVELNDFRQIFKYETFIFYNEKIFLKKSDENSLKINGILYDKIKKGRRLGVVKQEIKDLIEWFNVNRKNTVVICQNPSFDRSFFSHLFPVIEQSLLDFPYHWLDLASMFWAKKYAGKILLDKCDFSLSKDSISVSLELPPEKKPHRAMNGVLHLIECYKSLNKVVS